MTADKTKRLISRRWVSHSFHAMLIVVLLVAIGIRVYAYFSTSQSAIGQIDLSSGSAGDYRAAGNEAFSNERWREAAAAFEKLTDVEPENLRAWVRLAYSLHASGQWNEALAAHLRVSQFDGARAWSLYNIACIYALQGEKQLALDYLHESVEAGYRRREPIDENPDFKSLVDDPEFKRLAELVKPVSLRLVYRQFDFLIGRWDLLSNEDRRMGTMEVSQANERGYMLIGRCVDNTRALSMSILSYYEPGVRKWKQVWLDEQGTVTQVEGTPAEDDIFVLEGGTVTADGHYEMARITYQEVEGGFVNYALKRSPDSGITWEVLLEATLVPRANKEPMAATER